MTRPPCPGATTALAIAGSVLRTRYAGASFAYVAGSIIRGQGTHRHDTYSIGRTLSGVQSLHYKGSLRHGMPGNTLVLHPDEVHDGMCRTDRHGPNYLHTQYL